MKTLICLMGPTATGKTDLALRLCEAFPFEIISVDSALVYKGMDIGTAKPSREILDKIPHHLIDIREPFEAYSAADFCQDALKAVDDIVKRNKIPLLVGGTMLYFKALQEGLSILPAANQTIRDKITQEASALGWDVLHEQLKKFDPKSASRIHPNDPQRIGRALEVYYLTGKPLSDYFDEKEQNDFNFLSIGLFPQNRALLHQRIELRFNEMLKAGWIDEVKNLLGTPQAANEEAYASTMSLRMVGYRQIIQYLQHELDEKTMIEKGIIATRQLAKRQMTWLRHWSNITLLDPFKESIFEELSQHILDVIQCDRIGIKN